MVLTDLLEAKGLSIYKCSKLTGIPYTTLSQVVRGITPIGKCSAETVCRLAKTLGVPMESLLQEYTQVREDFEAFKSNVCHAVKDDGDLEFVISVLKQDQITDLWNRHWYPEALYLLAMLDYLCRINSLPICTKYTALRSQRLESPIYPRDVVMASKLDTRLDIKDACRSSAIPEFKRFNIIESEIRNVY